MRGDVTMIVMVAIMAIVPPPPPGEGGDGVYKERTGLFGKDEVITVVG